MLHREGTGRSPKVVVHEKSCGAPSTWRPTRKRSRSWMPETWQSSDFQSDRPVTEPSSPATSLSRRTHGAESARNTGSAGRNYTRSCAQESRGRRALSVQSGVSRPAPVSLVKSA